VPHPRSNVSATAVRALQAEAPATAGRSEPLACTLGRLAPERVAAGEGTPAHNRQKWGEVYTGGGAVVQATVCTLTEWPRLTVSAYYVLQPMHVLVKIQAFELGLTQRMYWAHLATAEACVDCALQVMARLQARVVCARSTGV
jgi:hypothetical protein